MFHILLLIAAVSAIDPTRFKDITIYEIQVASYFSGDNTIGFEKSWGPETTYWGGDLQGIINKLPKISKMGFNAIWLTPIFDTKYTKEQKDIFYCENHSSCGYFIADYYNIDPHFGTIEKFKELVNVAHENGIYVLLDGVFGHIKPTICGTGVPSHNNKSPACMEGACSATSEGSQMDYTKPETKEFFLEVAKHWVKEYKIDGWRLDAPYELSTTPLGQDNETTIEGNLVHEFRKAVEEAADENKAAGDAWGTLGYIVTDAKFQDPKWVKSWYGEGDTKTAYTWYDWPAVFKFRDAFLQKPAEGAALDFTGLVESINYVKQYPTWSYSVFCSANHDFLRLGNSIKNRWGYTPTDQKYWDLHLAFQMYQVLYPGLISVYYGEETGEFVEGYNKGGDLGAYDDNAGRSNQTPGSKLTDKQRAHRENLKLLLKWRKEHPLFSCRDCATTAEKDNELLVVKRTNVDGSTEELKDLIYIVNLNAEAKKITLGKQGSFCNVITKADVDATKEIEVPAYSSILIATKPATLPTVEPTQDQDENDGPPPPEDNQSSSQTSGGDEDSKASSGATGGDEDGKTSSGTTGGDEDNQSSSQTTGTPEDDKTSSGTTGGDEDGKTSSGATGGDEDGKTSSGTTGGNEDDDNSNSGSVMTMIIFFVALIFILF